MKISYEEMFNDFEKYNNLVFNKDQRKDIQSIAEKYSYSPREMFVLMQEWFLRNNTYLSIAYLEMLAKSYLDYDDKKKIKDKYFKDNKLWEKITERQEEQIKKGKIWQKEVQE